MKREMKKVNLKNYTSDISPQKSINRIEDLLVVAGASDISKRYKNGICEAITFRLLVKHNLPVFFKLPAKVDACFNVFWAARVKKTDEHRKIATEQASKPAWKIVSDWVEIQLSMIQLEQAEPLQIFLPYAYDPVTDETFFQKLEGSNFKQLTN